jgi:Flp pilus assembly protein TadD
MRKLVSIISIAAMILVAGACNKQDQSDEGSGKMSDKIIYW